MHFLVKTNPLFCFAKYVNSVVCFSLTAQTKLLMTWKKKSGKNTTFLVKY